MAFFTDVFTVETWEQAKARDFTVSGFPPPTPTKGGYFDSTFRRVKAGDTLLCYVKAPAKRWVGALRVESAMYLDENDPVWGADDNGTARFPARFRVSPIIVRDVEMGVPVEETIGVISCLQEKKWSGLFRRSLTPVGDEDGQRLLRLLEVEREPRPVRLPRKRVRRPTPLVEAVRDEGEAAAEATAEPEAQPTPHLELVAKLVRLGKTLGCDV